MALPSTRPSGRNPASRTSRNSLTDRSEVKIDPALPGCSSCSRLIASWGTPAASKSVICWLVIDVLLSSVLADVDPRRLAPLRVEGHDGERGSLIPSEMTALEPDDRGADVDGLDDVVAAALLGRALALADPQVHVRDGHALRAHALDVGGELLPRVVAGVVDQVSPAADLGVARGPARLPDGLPVVVPGRDRDAEDQPGRHPAAVHQLGEFLAGQVGGEQMAQRRRAGGADRGADGLELKPAGGELADSEP